MSDTLRHGMRSTYTHEQCRCVDCCEVNATYLAARRGATMDDGRRDTTSWDEGAACRGMDPDLWFPVSGHGKAHDWTNARAVCATCPVRAECLAYALDSEPVHEGSGMWGGATPEERRDLLRERRAAQRRQQRRSAR